MLEAIAVKLIEFTMELVVGLNTDMLTVKLSDMCKVIHTNIESIEKLKKMSMDRHSSVTLAAQLSSLSSAIDKCILENPEIIDILSKYGIARMEDTYDTNDDHSAG